jgi:hypothetical protein
VSALFRNLQPMAAMFFFLCAYFVIAFISSLVANYNNWPMEFAEFIPMFLLIAGDVYLYRRVSLPR